MRSDFNRVFTERLIALLAHIPKWMLPIKNLRRLRYQGRSKRIDDPLSRPEGLEIVPYSLICSIVFPIDEVDSLRESIIEMVGLYSKPSTRHSRSAISRWFADCVDRDGAATQYLSFTFPSMPDRIRPSLFTDAFGQVSQWSPSFVVLAFELLVNENYIQRFNELHKPFEWQYELSASPLGSTFGLRVFTGQMRRLEEKRRILAHAANEIRGFLHHFGIKNIREKNLTLTEVFAMSSNGVGIGISTN